MDTNTQTIELFSGTGSFSRVALENGFRVKTYDICPSADELAPDTHTPSDILDTGIAYPSRPRILWASPPCQSFSIASCSTHWNKEDGSPKSDGARLGMAILERTIQLIADLKPDIYFIENPRGLMRKRIDPLLEKYGLTPKRETVWYCRYGDSRAKPTDIWHSAKFWEPKGWPDQRGAICKNGNPDHAAAPRGAKTGTQGLKGARERSVIPRGLFLEIFQQLESHEQKKH